MLPCPNCKANELVLMDTRGHVELFACRQCGYEAGGTVFRLSDIPSMPESVALLVRWKAERPSVTELRTLRRTFSQFRDVSIKELLATLGEGPTAPLGRFPRPIAEELRRGAHANGLLLDIVPVDLRGA